MTFPVIKAVGNIDRLRFAKEVMPEAKTLVAWRSEVAAMHKNDDFGELSLEVVSLSHYGYIYYISSTDNINSGKL